MSVYNNDPHHTMVAEDEIGKCSSKFTVVCDLKPLCTVPQIPTVFSQNLPPVECKSFSSTTILWSFKAIWFPCLTTGVCLGYVIIVAN